MRFAGVLVGVGVLVAATPGVAGAAVVHVETGGVDGPACGATVTTACRTITRALAISAPGGTVRVGPGRFGIEEPPRGGGIAITKSITLEGAQAGVDPRPPGVRVPDGPDETTIYDADPATKAGGLFTAVVVSNVTVDGFTFTGSTQGSGVQLGTKTPPRDGYRVVNNIFYRNAVGMYPDASGPGPSLIEHNLFQEQGNPAMVIAGNGNGLYASEHRNVTIRENLFVDNDQTLAIDTRTLTQGGVVGGGDITFTRNVSRGGSGPVFTSVDGLTITDNTIEGSGSRGLYLGGNEQDDVHVLRNSFTGFTDIGVYLRQANPNTPQNGFVELRQNTITNNGRGIVITADGAQDRLEIEHNRIVYNAGGGLVNNDPDVDVDARRNWWGCNAGPGPNPTSCAGCGPAPDLTCDEVAHPGAGSAPAFTPWMTLSFTATPAVQDAGDTSTLRASLDNLSDLTAPAGPFFLTGQALFASTPAGTHTPPTVPLTPANVSAQSAYAAGAEDPDELRTTVDRQTIPIRISRPPAPDIVPFITPDDPTVTPGQLVELVIELINRGNAPAQALKACVRLDEQLDARTGLCQTIRRLLPGHGTYRRIVARVRRDACAARLSHRFAVTGTRGARARGRVLAGPCRVPPCPAARTAVSAGHALYATRASFMC